jgi:hypothetical protein
MVERVVETLNTTLCAWRKETNKSNPSLAQKDRGRRLHKPSYFDHGPGNPRVGDKVSSRLLSTRPQRLKTIMNVDHCPLGLAVRKA